MRRDRVPGPPKWDHATALSVEQRHETQILQTFSNDLGGPREDTGTSLYGTERIAAFSARRPREERYYGTDLRGSNRTVTDERGAVGGVQGFDSWGAPDPGKHAGNEQGNAFLSKLIGYVGERQDTLDAGNEINPCTRCHAAARGGSRSRQHRCLP